MQMQRLVRGFAVLALAAMLNACHCGDADLGALHPLLVASTSALRFDDTFLGASRQLTLSLTDAGTAPVLIDDASIDNGVYTLAHKIGAPVPARIGPGQNVDVIVVFTPTALGDVKAHLTIASNATNTPSLVIDLDGAGLTPLDCDDHNECTDEHFDPTSGTCVRTNHDGSCDDRSACTTNDRCFLGACVGDAVVCGDAQECTRDTCDPATGCAFIPDDTLCADDDPCSLDRCDATVGCTHNPAPDGTPCGSFAECVSVDLCIAHLCTPVTIPDNTPCSDDNVCTIDDHCAAGLCAGTATHLPPTVLAESHRVVAPVTSAFIGDTLFISDGTVKVLDVSGSGPVFPTSSIDLIPGPSQLLASGQHLVGVGDTNQIDQHLRIVDPFAAPPALLADVDVGRLFSTNRPGTIASDGNTFYGCRADAPGGLVAVALTAPFHLAVLTTSACPPLGTFNARAIQGDLALDTPGTSGGALVLHVHALVSSTIVDEPDVALPSAFGAIWLGTDRAVLSGGTGSSMLAVDVSDPAHVSTAELHAGDVACLALNPVAMIGRALYCEDSGTIQRTDFTDINNPVPDLEWQTANLGGAGFDNDDTRMINGQGFGTAASIVSLLGAGAVTPIGARGGIAHVAIDTSGGVTRMLGVSDAAAVLLPPVSTDVSVLAAEGVPGALVGTFGIASVGNGAPALIELPTFNDASNGGVSYGGVNAGIIGDGPDVVANIDDFTGLFGANMALDGTALGATPEVVFPSLASPQYFASAGDGCLGLAVTQAVTFNPVGVPGTLPLVTAVSICNPALPTGGLVPLGTASLNVVLDGAAFNHIKIVVHHDTVATVFLDDRINLVDFTDPTLPLVIASGAFENTTAIFRDADFDAAAQVWLVALTEPDGTATITQLAPTADTTVLSTWQVPVGSPGAILRQRVLAVLFPRAYLSAWDNAGAPDVGHGVAIYDLTTSPPSLEETVPLASEPVDLVPLNDTLAVARVDGMTLISPPCGP